MSVRNADYSVFISNVLDVMGYSFDMVKQRRLMFTMEDYNRADSKTRYIVAGSKGEGTSSYYECDFDIMVVYKYMICTDDISRYHDSPNITVFQPLRRRACPGYTFLKVSRYGKLGECTGNSSVHDDFLPSSLYRSFYKYVNDESNELNAFKPPEGPSLPVEFCKLHGDMVISFKCQFPDITETFLSRHRKFNQPSKETLEEVAKLDSHVVAVGSKRGDRPDLEWRISYTEAELHLMRDLNETQIKLYILLKLLAKSNFGDSNIISSYILKNIVLWMSELLSRDTFRSTLLVQRLLDALRLLRHCVKNRYLPNYMIPERNLFCGKLKHHEHLKLLQQLTKMVDEGEHVLFLCPRLKQAMVAMYDSPIKARRIGNIRDVIEQWYYQWTLDINGDDEICNLVKLVCRKEFDEYRNKRINIDVFQSKVHLKLQKLLL